MGDEGTSVEVVLTTMNGQLAHFRFDPQETITRVKKTVQEEFGFPKYSQQLLQQGSVVEEYNMLASLPRPLLLSLVILPFSKAEAVFQAAKDGHEAAVRSLLLHVASDCEERRSLLLARTGDIMRSTALIIATNMGHELACRVLLESAPDVEVQMEMLAAKDYIGCTALLSAAVKGHEAACRALLESAPSPDARAAMLAARMTSGFSRTALQVAAMGGYGAASRVLLELAPSPEVQREMLLAKDRSGTTALMAAVGRGREAACRELLQVAKDIGVEEELLAMQSDEGKTASQVASGACRPLLDAV